MSEHYRNMMNQIKLSDETKKDFKERLSQESSTAPHRNYSLRRALIAACLCIIAIAAVVGVAAANEPIDVNIINEVSSVSESSFDVSAILKPRTEDFSKELLEDIESGKVEKAFYSKDELEEYLGFSLISSPELEAAGINENLARDFEYNANVPPELEIDVNARYIVTETVIGKDSSDHQIRAVKITCHRIFMNTAVYIDAKFLAEPAEVEYSAISFSAESFESVLLPHHEFIINPDDPSDFHVITTDYMSAQKDFSIESYTMANGCTAKIVTIADIEMDGSKGFRQYRGYFVKKGILYSINPYAIYDPSQSFPMNDYDMLEVLTEVLDSFK